MSASPPKHCCRITCPCGFKGVATVFHYSYVRCACGRRYWALQPKRGGPFVLFPWPGDYREARAKAAAALYQQQHPSFDSLIH